MPVSGFPTPRPEGRICIGFVYFVVERPSRRHVCTLLTVVAQDTHRAPIEELEVSWQKDGIHLESLARVTL